MHICTHTRLYTQSGETALHIALREERDDIVELLLEANADPDLPVKVITHTTHGSHGDMNQTLCMPVMNYTYHYLHDEWVWFVTFNVQRQNLNLLVISSSYY